MADLVSEASRPLGDLRAKRGAPAWVRTAKSGQSTEVWRRLREELPRPLEKNRSLPALREERFPGCEAAVEQAEDLLAGESGIEAIKPSDDVERLQLLVVLLDAFGFGDYPPDDDSLRDVWWWVWAESERLASPEARFEDSFLRLLHAEALIASGVFFAGLAGMRSRGKAGRERLWAEIEEQTDADGMPRAELLDSLSAWLGALARCGSWAGAGDLKWGKAAELERCDGLARAVAAMLRPDGTCGLREGGIVSAWVLSCGRLLRWKNSDPAMRMLSRMTLGMENDQEQSKRRKTRPVLLQSEWARLMVLRSGWEANADLVSIRHDGPLPTLEWQVDGGGMMAGEWGLDLRVDGKPIALTADWDAVSWFEDREVVYLELQWTGPADLVVCRQVLFTRSDQQLWLADAVSTPGCAESEIELITRLPLVEGWEIEQRRPTRELRLQDGEGRAVRCVPLSFPMEGTQEGPGVVRAGAGEFQVRQTGRGGVYCPLLFDWHGPRGEAAVDWRRLTVTEDGRRLGGGEAAAARVRIGPQQWVIYRNLNGSTAMRAVIGYHHNQESVIGHFTRDGELDPLVLVEAGED